MTIGQVAAESGLAASAIRFYEQEGVVPRPARIAGRRHYDASVPDQLAMLERAKACGFSLAEIRRLIHGFREGTPPSWRFPRICVRSDFLMAQWTWRFCTSHRDCCGESRQRMPVMGAFPPRNRRR